MAMCYAFCQCPKKVPTKIFLVPHKSSDCKFQTPVLRVSRLPIPGSSKYSTKKSIMRHISQVIHYWDLTINTDVISTKKLKGIHLKLYWPLGFPECQLHNFNPIIITINHLISVFVKICKLGTTWYENMVCNSFNCNRSTTNFCNDSPGCIQ